MAVTLDARVRQKVATEAEWLADDTILLGGEQAFVISALGTPINFKIGDGTKTFAELPYFFNYNNANFIGAIVPSSSAPAGNIWAVATEPGTYVNFNNTLVPPNSLAIISRVGGVWMASIDEFDFTAYVKYTDLSAYARITDLLNYVPVISKGQAGGVASLDESGKVPLSQINLSGLSGATLLGSWDASMNIPELENGTGNDGDYYNVSVGGTVDFGDGEIQFKAGDRVSYFNGKWELNPQSAFQISESSATGFISL